MKLALAIPVTILTIVEYTGKPENQFAFSGEAKNRKYAMEIIHECEAAWKRLVAGQVKSEISLCALFSLVLCVLVTDSRRTTDPTSPLKVRSGKLVPDILFTLPSRLILVVLPLLSMDLVRSLFVLASYWTEADPGLTRLRMKQLIKLSSFQELP